MTIGSDPRAARLRHLREDLAALCHEQWSGWMKHLFSKSSYPNPRGAIIPGNLTERWMRQMNTPYAELSEDEKNSDRDEADRILVCLSEVEQAHPPQAGSFRERADRLMRCGETLSNGTGKGRFVFLDKVQALADDDDAELAEVRAALSRLQALVDTSLANLSAVGEYRRGYRGALEMVKANLPEPPQ